MNLTRKAFENIVGKEENAWSQHFLLFRPCFPTLKKQILSFWLYIFCRLQMLPIWIRQNFCCLVKS